MSTGVKRQGEARPAARAALGARVLLAVIAVIALGVAGIAGVNLVAVMRFNQATVTLNENLKNAERDDVDLDALGAGQQQVDAQFADAQALSFLLIPQVKEPISRNATVSRKLTTRTTQKIAEQKGQTTTDADQQATDAGTGTGSGSSGKGGGLTAKQKQQVEELLKANQQSTPSQSTTKQEDATKQDQSSTQSTKPW